MMKTSTSGCLLSGDHNGKCAVISSGGDLQNAEALADRLTKLVYTASRIPVSPDRRETFHKISVIWEQFMYVITVSNHRIYVCKRPYNPQDPAVA
uniref:Late endosomal/lysosomal adaptor and MAPK and MTOR activator 4 n=1 Tax=Magallana gigas TaxID=29159 RepID=A0A8W8IY91_MAGGI